MQGNDLRHVFGPNPGETAKAESSALVVAPALSSRHLPLRGAADRSLSPERGVITFCSRESVGNYALTLLKGNPRRTGSAI